MKYIFKPDGMSEKELCEYANTAQLYPKYSLLESEKYGCGKYYRKYGFYPKWLPLRVLIPHSPSQWDIAASNFINSDVRAFCFFSERLKNDFTSRTGKKSHIVLSPFVFYKNLMDIKANEEATGSLFFYSHSTPWAEVAVDDKLILELFSDLPSYLLPVSVCMHYMDIKLKRHLFYLENNIPVYTAGSWDSPFFIENFYEILRHFRFTLSNALGSYILFSTNYGIPSSIIGPKARIVSCSDSNFDSNLQQFGTKHKHEQEEMMYDLFSGIHLKVTDKQRDKVDLELGVNNHLSRLRFSYLLYTSLILDCFAFLPKVLKRAINALRGVDIDG